MSYPAYVDVHAHLTDSKFGADLEQVIQRADKAGLKAIIVNGLEPESNRQILELARRHPLIKPAMGIYPVDAVNDLLPANLPFSVRRFDVRDEIRAIEAAAAAGQLAAIGECGLDGHWLGDETFGRQEEVFEQLIEVALRHHLPLIIHTRKREQRAADILAHHKVSRVNFHCFGGRVNLAKKLAEDAGYWFSIPANAQHNEAFQKMLRELPMERLLTETDCPYLGPTRGQRSEPCHVVGTVELLAKLRGQTSEQAMLQIAANYTALFGQRWL